MGRIIFVTGTDTGVGKTVLTGLLLTFLRSRGVRALAMKPFCTGDRADVAFLQALQPLEMIDDEANPFWFRHPVAPLLAARKERREVSLAAAISHVNRVAQQCEILLVEGAGGALVPLTEDADVAELIGQLNCEVIIVGANKLGVINHIRLTIEALLARQVRRINVILMDQWKADASSVGNARYLRQVAANIGVFSLPFFGRNCLRQTAMEKAAKKNQKVLAQICDSAKFSPVLWNAAETRRPKQQLARKKNR